MPRKKKSASPKAGGLATPPDQYDTPWKDVAGRFFPQLVEFFAPGLYQKIEWSVGYEFLEQELREILRDSETGPRRVDKVVKVWMRNGKPRYIVLHVEIQVSRESGFPQRMFLYYIRLYELHPEAVESLAILGDEDPDWKPERYEHTLGETSSEKRFRRKLDELEQESQMRYVTSIERLSREEGLEEGLEKGRKEGYLEIVLSQAEERFGPLDESLRKTVQEAPVDQIMEWAKRLLRASSLDEVFAT